MSGAPKRLPQSVQRNVTKSHEAGLMKYVQDKSAKMMPPIPTAPIPKTGGTWTPGAGAGKSTGGGGVCITNRGVLGCRFFL